MKGTENKESNCIGRTTVLFIGALALGVDCVFYVIYFLLALTHGGTHGLMTAWSILLGAMGGSVGLWASVFMVLNSFFVFAAMLSIGVRSFDEKVPQVRYLVPLMAIVMVIIGGHVVLFLKYKALHPFVASFWIMYVLLLRKRLSCQLGTL